TLATVKPAKDPIVKRCVEALSHCGGFNLRRTARVVTQLYDQALEPTGIRSTQLVILWTVAVDDAPSMAQLARELVLDPSTLSRNVKPLVRRGLLEVTYSGR